MAFGRGAFRDTVFVALAAWGCFAILPGCQSTLPTSLPAPPAENQPENSDLVSPTPARPRLRSSNEGEPQVILNGGGSPDGGGNPKTKKNTKKKKQAPKNPPPKKKAAAEEPEERETRKPRAAKPEPRPFRRPLAPAKDPRLEKAEKDLNVHEQQNRFLADKFFETGMARYREFDFPEARKNFEEALRLNPDHADARKMLDEVNLAMGERAAEIRTVKEFVQNQLLVKIEQTAVEARNHMREGRTALKESRFKDAIREFEQVEEKLRWTPYDIGLTKQREKANELLAVARQRAEIGEQELAQMQRDMARKKAKEEEDKRNRILRDNVRKLMQIALDHFEEGRYKKAEEVSNEVLRIVPNHRAARELRDDAIRVRHNEDYVKFLALRKERWRSQFEDIEESTIPLWDRDLVRFPGLEEWERIMRRAESMGVSDPGAAEEDPEVANAKEMLNTLVDLDFIDVPLSDIVNFLADFSRVNMYVSNEVKAEGIADTKISFQLKQKPVAVALRLVLRQYGLDYTFDGSVVKITKPELAAGAPVLQVHDVRDLLGQIPDFAGPTLELQGAEGGSPTTGFTPPEEVKVPIAGEQLETLIRENIAPTTWEQEGVSLSLTGNQQLLVVHSVQVQRDIRAFLRHIRSFTGAMVSVEARFISVTDDFLEEVGVEFRGLEDSGLFGGAADGVYRPMQFTHNVHPDTEDVDDGLGGDPGPDGAVPAARQTGEAGIFIQENYGPNDLYDLRFRTVYPLTGVVAGGLQDFPLSSRLLNRGGVGIQYRILLEQEVNAVLRMVRKSEKATQLTAPRVTAFNGQRAHVLVAEQRAYVQDFDVEIAQGASSFDPVINVVQDGLVLDVRPIISNDRKYVTLEVRPTLARLRDLRLFDITPATTLVADQFIQLPLLELQRAQTTVRMPDRGTLLLAGLKNVLDRELRSETPLLADLPILGFMFKKEGSTLERRNLLILIYSEIIDLAEEEIRQ